MRTHAPFSPSDLGDLGYFLARANVCRMDDVRYVLDQPRIIGMRHDCDNVIAPAVHMAEWEHERGIRSTYYILHTAPYWNDKMLLRSCLEAIAQLGHEIGIHNDAITVHLETGRDPADVLHEAIDELRRYGHTIRSTVAHGHARCAVDRYVNDEMFGECRRADYGDVERLGITPISLAALDLDFDANWIGRGDYLSDSGGKWSQPWDEVTSAWPGRGQLHMLIHPDWWAQAFPQKVAA